VRGTRLKRGPTGHFSSASKKPGGEAPLIQKRGRGEGKVGERKDRLRSGLQLPTGGTATSLESNCCGKEAERERNSEEVGPTKWGSLQDGGGPALPSPGERGPWKSGEKKRWGQEMIRVKRFGSRGEEPSHQLWALAHVQGRLVRVASVLNISAPKKLEQKGRG